MRTLHDGEWKNEYFRMSDEAFAKLLEVVGPLVQKKPTHKLPISAEARLAFTLMALASGHSLKFEHKRFRWGYCTAVQIFHETCAAIWTALKDEYMGTPKSDQWTEIEDKFYTRWNFPGCLGAVDGKHVVIQKPARAGSQFFNYKKDHSLVLMAVVDADYKFSYIDVGAYRRESDSGVFSRSRFCKAVYAPSNPLDLPGQFRLPGSDLISNHVFIGDEAFAGSHRLVHPYSGSGKQTTLSVGHRVFNYRLSRARRIVENAFGILATRWRIFRRPITYAPARVIPIIQAACVLHNFLRMNSTEYMPPSYVDSEDSDDGQWRSAALPSSVLEALNTRASSEAERFKTGCKLRDTLLDYFMSEAGAVAWQLEKI